MVLWLLFAFLTALLVAYLFSSSKEFFSHTPAPTLQPADACAQNSRDTLSFSGSLKNLPLNSAHMILVSLCLSPLFALYFYLFLGRPDLPALPAASRLALAVEHQDWPAMVAKIERHLQKNPQDVRGWLLLAPIYRAQQNWNAALSAYEKAATLSPNLGQAWFDWGTTLLEKNGGHLTKEAEILFQRALKTPDRSSEEQAWRNQAKLYLKKPIEMPQADTSTLAAIQGMVERLHMRLRQTPNDGNGWIKLMRSYVVLGNKAQAYEAFQEALTHFAESTQERKKIQEAARSFHLEVKNP